MPGVYASRASGFASGKPLDTAPGCLTLGQFAEVAAGEDDRYPGASDDELAGVICAWDRVEAYASSRKHAAVAELIRRRPAPGCAVAAGPAQLPGASDEFVAQELAAALGETRAAAGDMVSLAQELAVNLPGTRAAFRAGILSRRKAMIIAEATVLLDPAQARAAEAMVLGRAGTLTPPGLRAAIARAVMDVAPGKAKKRREHEADEDPGGAVGRGVGERGAGRAGTAARAGAGRGPARDRVGQGAAEGGSGGRDGCAAGPGLPGHLARDGLPAPRQPPDGTGQPQDPARPQGPARPRDPAPAPGPGGPLAGMIPPGFAGQVTLTIPEATVTGRADRPGELGGIGPVDPDLARDLAAAAARNPRSTWCVTVTDQDGHAVGHGCARPARRRKPGGPDPPGESRVHLHPRRSARPARRVRDVAVHRRAAGDADRDRAAAGRGV